MGSIHATGPCLRRPRPGLARTRSEWICKTVSLRTPVAPTRPGCLREPEPDVRDGDWPLARNRPPLQAAADGSCLPAASTARVTD